MCQDMLSSGFFFCSDISFTPRALSKYWLIIVRCVDKHASLAWHKQGETISSRWGVEGISKNLAEGLTPDLNHLNP